ncbi:hypothetical protein TNCV_3048871 [Trichonephila clavipes]|nr:hypothetical protein TNCV_3048871 [Trichonephila clavipes]
MMDYCWKNEGRPILSGVYANRMLALRVDVSSHIGGGLLERLLIFMDDNSRLHETQLINGYLKTGDIQNMESTE